MYIHEATILALRYDYCIQRESVRCFKYKPMLKRENSGRVRDKCFQRIPYKSPIDGEKTPRRWSPRVEDAVANDWTITP